MEVDSDGDFRLRNDDNIESGFLFRAEFVYIAGKDNEETTPVPQQKMRPSLVDKSALGVVPIVENESKAGAIESEVKAAPIEQKSEPKLVPAAPPTTTAGSFEVMLQRNGSTDKVGLHLDMTDETAFEIISVQDGLVKSYNSTVPESKQIFPGYFVVGINGKPPKDNLADMSSSSQLKVQIAPRTIFTVTLTKSGTASFGMNLSYNDTCASMLLVGCAAGSVVDTYNKSAPPAELLNTGDRIIEVNGTSGNAKQMFEAMKMATTLTLKVARPVR
jgi:hypothetical protein